MGAKYTERRQDVKKSFEKEMEELLCTKTSAEEEEELASLGIKVKNPTKQTVLAAALYKKAKGGDLSAIREIFAALKGKTGETGSVIFIDDIKDKA